MTVAELVVQLFTKDPNARIVFVRQKGMLTRHLPPPVFHRTPDDTLTLSFLEDDTTEAKTSDALSQGVFLGLFLGIFLSVLCWLAVR